MPCVSVSRVFAMSLALTAPLILLAQPATAQQKPPPATIRIVDIPIANFTPLQIAKEKGYFEEENLNVSWTPVQQGAIAIQAVFGGSAEIGASAIFETIVARGNELDLMFITGQNRIRAEPPDNSGLLVRTDDSVKTPQDLAGKRISAGLINSVNYVHMLEWLDKKGVDRSKIEFLEVPFPQMADALAQKRVDAVWNVEPFVTFMTKSGAAKIMAYPYQETVPNMDISNYFAKESWIKANPDVVKRFKRAIDRATAEINAVSKEERDGWVAKFTGMKPEVVKDVSLPRFVSDFNIPSLKANLDIAVKQKMIKPFDIDVMIYKP
jgi:NitT/TauT family transport system substrate-binding protein